MLQEDPSLGPNSWLVEEMHDLYRESPSLVSESWRVYFDNRDGVITPAALHATKGVLNGAGNGVMTPSRLSKLTLQLSETRLGLSR